MTKPNSPETEIIPESVDYDPDVSRDEESCYSPDDIHTEGSGIYRHNATRSARSGELGRNSLNDSNDVSDLPDPDMAVDTDKSRREQ